MQKVDHHDVIHVALYELGDKSKEAPAMETIISANKKGVVAIHEELAKINS